VFVINRSFDIPVETMFKMWTDPKHFSQWLGPVGTRMEYIHDEIKAGKTTSYKMTYESGLAINGKMTYLKVEQPNYLEYTQIFCDEHGKPCKHPNVPVWPDVMLTRVLLSEEGENQTRVTVTWEPHGNVSQAELKAFTDMKSGMSQGWSEAFDKLESYTQR